MRTGSRQRRGNGYPVPEGQAGQEAARRTAQGKRTDERLIRLLLCIAASRGASSLAWNRRVARPVDPQERPARAVRDCLGIDQRIERGAEVDVAGLQRGAGLDGHRRARTRSADISSPMDEPSRSIADSVCLRLAGTCSITDARSETIGWYAPSAGRTAMPPLAACIASHARDH